MKVASTVWRGANRKGAVKCSLAGCLPVTNEARLLGTDPRLINKEAADETDSKVNKCVSNIYDRYIDTNGIKGTQIVFCDVGTPNSDGRFCIYDDIKNKLIKKGISKEEICFIHDVKTEVQREKLFADMRSGEKRIIIGSTSKMGTGVNIQDRLIALHHLDTAWKPSSIEQREGRILRQGNMNDEVYIYRYVTKGTFDSYMWGLVENKQKFISQIMTSKSVTRSCEDIDETVLSFAEVKALATGNPKIKQKMDIDNEVSRLKVLKSAYNSQRYSLQDDFTIRYPKLITQLEQKIECIIKDIERRDMNNSQDFSINIGGKIFDEKQDAGTMLESFYSKVQKDGSEINAGNYRGFGIILKGNYFDDRPKLILHGNLRYSIELGSSPHGNMTRIENALNSLESKISTYETKLEEYRKNIKQSKLEYDKAFQYEDELRDKIKRQAELNAELDIGNNSKDDVLSHEDSIEDDNTVEIEKSEYDKTEELVI